MDIHTLTLIHEPKYTYVLHAQKRNIKLTNDKILERKMKRLSKNEF